MPGRTAEEKAAFLAEVARKYKLGSENLTPEELAALDAALRDYIHEQLSPEEKELVDGLVSEVIEISGGGDPRRKLGRSKKSSMMGRLGGLEVVLRLAALLQRETGGEGWPSGLFHGKSIAALGRPHVVQGEGTASQLRRWEDGVGCRLTAKPKLWSGIGGRSSARH